MNNFAKRLASDIPLMTAAHLAFITAPGKRDTIQAAEHPMFSKFRESMRPKAEMRGNLAIVPVQGALAYNPDVDEMFYDGVEDSRNVLSMVKSAAADSSVEGILLRMDTPGGMLLGGPEIADAVRSAAKSKPVVAHIGGLGASLGYMIASQAREVIANPSAIVGSIGVIASVTDWTGFLSNLGIKFEYFTNKEAKYKAAGAIGTSLTDDQRANIQGDIEKAFSLFKSTVLSKRPQVKPEAMQGQTFRGSEAKAMGLIDRVGDEDFAMSVLRASIPKQGNP